MRIIAHIPNSITLMNLLSGSLAVCFSFYGEFMYAILCIVAAAIFDFLDGFSARLLHAYSPVGKELDSLADMVSFGLAPAFIAFNRLLYIWGISLLDVFDTDNAFIYCISLAATLMIVLFSALRLGKFNIDTRQSENFIGLATPANALFIGSLMCTSAIYQGFNSFLNSNWWIIPVASVALSLLLVAEIPMFSFKFKNLGWKDNAIRFVFIGIAALLGIVVLIAGLSWCVWLSLIFACYIIMNIIYGLSVK